MPKGNENLTEVNEQVSYSVNHEAKTITVIYSFAGEGNLSGKGLSITMAHVGNQLTFKSGNDNYRLRGTLSKDLPKAEFQKAKDLKAIADAEALKAKYGM